MTEDFDRSLGGEQTAGDLVKRRASAAEVSLGDERTLGDGRSGQETVIDDIEVVDLEARYRIEGTLGQGGMGAVLLATDTRLDRKVAIKRILGEAAGNRMAVNRFLTEAKAIAALNHPNIVQIYDYGRAKDGPFLIMEYVDGGSLLDRCRESALPLNEAIDLACQLCDGLAKAHDLGIVHRDIKPANVLLTKDGIPKLTDFGLAKAQASDHGQTMTGAVLGTPDFMPPEQRRDASLVDHRSDLWSLAATIYQMVTGRSPKIIRFDLLPVELTKVLGKALEDAKESRYQSARELRDSLKTSLHSTAAVEELAEGACPSCGVKNESNRRFCRGCGESLEAPCLSCSKPMPMWEHICGQCGTKQAPLIESRREEMASRQAEAEELLRDYEFDRATAIAAQLRDQPHPKLKHLVGWADVFLQQVDKSRSDQTTQAVESIEEAGKHRAAGDFLSAIFALESIPHSLRQELLPGTRETVAALLERLKASQKELTQLEALVRKLLAEKSFDDVLPLVTRLLELQPDRGDIRKLQAQLLGRQQKQDRMRDDAIASAKHLIATHDYAGAVAAISVIAHGHATTEVMSLKAKAEFLESQASGLKREIRSAVAEKRLDGLLDSVREYLTLKPGDADALKLSQVLQAREEKAALEQVATSNKAQMLAKESKFGEAVMLLAGIQERQRRDVVKAQLVRFEALAVKQKEAHAAIRAALAKQGESLSEAAVHDYATVLENGEFVDEEFQKLLALVKARRRFRRLQAAGAAAGLLVIVLVVLGVGISYLAAEKYDGAVDTVVFKVVPICLLIAVAGRYVVRWWSNDR